MKILRDLRMPVGTVQVKNPEKEDYHCIVFILGLEDEGQ
jgi:hypothetical protein